MSVVKKVGVGSLWVLLVLVTAIVTAAVKQRFDDGPNRVFSGGALVSGELHLGPEPDWSFVNDIATIELQLLEPEQSRRIWTASVDGKVMCGPLHEQSGSKLWKSCWLRPSVMGVRLSVLTASATSVSWFASKAVLVWKN